MAGMLFRRLSPAARQCSRRPANHFQSFRPNHASSAIQPLKCTRTAEQNHERQRWRATLIGNESAEAAGAVRF
jgi:hypothetical protein